MRYIYREAMLLHTLLLLFCVTQLTAGAGYRQDKFNQFRGRTGVTVTREGDYNVIRASGLPDHTTANRPDCSVFHGPSSQDWEVKIPVRPQHDKELCLPKGMIGMSVNGVPLENPYNPRGDNHVEGKCFDVCNGHSDSDGNYHYHSAPICLHTDESGRPKRDLTNGLVGVALDGHFIFISTDSNGDVISPNDLDECNGKIVTRDGRDVYEYHVTTAPPYLIGCFRGDVPDKDLIPGQKCFYACRSYGLTISNTPCSANTKSSHSRLFKLLNELLEEEN